MARKMQLLDRFGVPVKRTELTKEISAATTGGVRSPITGYPASGLNPVRLAGMLKSADAGDPVRFLELAETIEERDLHYLGVMGTRKRSVSQIDITVEAASDADADVKKADMVRDWLKRDELTSELFDILDCLGKGYSFTEIMWDTSEGQWRPDRLEWRDPRWFRFEQSDLRTPLMLDNDGRRLPLPAFKFIFATIKAKSGLPLRSGLARVAAWAWMFKAYTQRDWSIFTQTYGQPLRVGKFGSGASDEDKDTLFRAVANIAGDCAAIIPESMSIDFIEAGNLSATGELYKDRADWLDRQVSKAVLGQTATTDAISGGHAVGQEHREVQEDIERADARALAGIINRDLIRTWMDLEFGPQKEYPRVVIARPDAEDLDALVGSVAKLVPLGLRVGQGEMRDRLGLADPDENDEILGQTRSDTDKPPPVSKFKRDSGEFLNGVDQKRPEVAKNAERPSEGRSGAPSLSRLQTDRLAIEAADEVNQMIQQIRVMTEKAGSLQELHAMITAGFPEVSSANITDIIAKGLMTAHASGRIEVAEESDD